MASYSDLTERFADRHIGPRPDDRRHMLDAIGVGSTDELIDQTVPPSIRASAPLDLDPALTEPEALAQLAELASRNRVMTNLIGLGYSGTTTPPVIRRNVLENPAWYTAYTPYQPEISQGRLEALINFQTMVADLTGLDIANASLLDEATAAAETGRSSSSTTMSIPKLSPCCEPVPNRSASSSWSATNRHSARSTAAPSLVVW
jgi:glycine dehydrogenase